MKRGEFLKEMKNSLFETVKSVYEPLLEDDIKKVENVADRALGIQWLPLMKENENLPELEVKFIDGRPIIVSHYDTNMQVMDGICPVCSNIIVVTTLYSSGKCLNCEKDFNFKTNKGDLKLKSLPLKVKGHEYYIGLQNIRNRK